MRKRIELPEAAEVAVIVNRAGLKGAARELKVSEATLSRYLKNCGYELFRVYWRPEDAPIADAAIRTAMGRSS